MTHRSSNDLPGQATLLASWRALAALSPGARTFRSSLAAGAVFPAWGALNNAIALNPAGPDGYDNCVAATTPRYARAGVQAWALWVPSLCTDFESPDAVLRVGALKRDTTTLVMQCALSRRFPPHRNVIRTSVAIAGRAGDEPVPEGQFNTLSGERGIAGWVMVQNGHAVAGAWSLVHRGDCGIYAVATVPEWRCRGIARALVGHVLADAERRGARTATLQSTPMGQRLYQSLGFVPVGRYEEWVPD